MAGPPELCGRKPIAVWWEGPGPQQLAHELSDIDLVALVDEPVQVCSYRAPDGVRVDLSARTVHEHERLRALLQEFDVVFDDIESFRVVRARMKSLSGWATSEVVAGELKGYDEAERAVYQRWALADQVEAAHSLVEDLVGLLGVGATESADVVWAQLRWRLTAAALVARGLPLLGDKWLPQLRRRCEPLVQLDDLTSLVAQGGPAALTARFDDVRAVLTASLEAVWGPAPPGGVADLGWLPQVYADGWFDRFGEDRRPRSGATGGRHARDRRDAAADR